MKRNGTITVLVVLVVLVMTACLFPGGTVEKRYDGMVARAAQGRVIYTSTGSYGGIEIEFGETVLERQVQVGEGKLHILQQGGKGSVLAVASEAGRIERGEMLFTIEADRIPAIEVIQKGEEEGSRIGEPYPEGISIRDLELEEGQAGEIEIWGKGLANVSGIGLTIEYPEGSVGIDPAHAGAPVEVGES
ncbi:MAG TPA: hypothetical protein P5560_13175, partial [Thermotogota bacterium]|nr:hypothetical protein [Thermotogota bacterium]